MVGSRERVVYDDDDDDDDADDDHEYSSSVAGFYQPSLVVAFNTVTGCEWYALSIVEGPNRLWFLVDATGQFFYAILHRVVYVDRLMLLTVRSLRVNV